MFNSALLAERSTKIVWKIIWTMRSIVAKPQIEEMHSRKIHGKVKEEEFVRRSAGRAYIEPEWGYIISENGSLIAHCSVVIR
ncbi:MAG: hypothetical protein EOM24_05570 [Chloroflexia bacterium]|nr:hypothetical protein [Chloroflexia bacterium]